MAWSGLTVIPEIEMTSHILQSLISPIVVSYLCPICERHTPQMALSGGNVKPDRTSNINNANNKLASQVHTTSLLWPQSKPVHIFHTIRPQVESWAELSYMNVQGNYEPTKWRCWIRTWHLHITNPVQWPWCGSLWYFVLRRWSRTRVILGGNFARLRPTS